MTSPSMGPGYATLPVQIAENVDQRLQLPERIDAPRAVAGITLDTVR